MNHPVVLIALQEFTLNRRNRWVSSFAVLFALLTFFIAYFGMVTAGYSGFQDFARTSTSLISLTGFLVPLFALMLTVFSFISNPEYLEMMVAQPVSRRQVIAGKYLGLVLTLLAATLLGFSVPGILISLVVGLEGALGYALVVLFSEVLGIVFTGCAVLLVQLARRRQIALGLAMALWLFFEVIYGLLVLGTTLYLPNAVLQSGLIVALAGNPIDIFRVLSLLVVGGAEFFGPAGAALLKLVGSQGVAVLIGSSLLLLWGAWPLFLSFRIFSRQNL